MMNSTVLNKSLKKDKTISIEDINQSVLDAYNKHAVDYILNTPQDVYLSPVGMKEWIDAALKSISKNGKIFEIGSATTRDAAYMRSQGYTVICSDAADEFLRIMKINGENAVKFNVLTDRLSVNCELIYANGIFPHFTAQQAELALENLYTPLKKGSGKLAFSIKEGVGESYIYEKMGATRFTHYWQISDIEKLLHKKGYEVIFKNSNLGGYKSHRWINFVCKVV